jgi:tetratricopeptide (TPR) repeat protein
MSIFDQRYQRVDTQINIAVIQPPDRPPLQRPPRATHFTGREEGLAQLLADLQPGRVVTLSGPGGVGKTALAAEAIWILAPGHEPPERFPDGILFHSFYTQTEAALALEAIARAYGEEPRPSPRDAARRVLAGRRALLVLDGAENADDLGAVLAVAGGCGVLVTSRRRGDAPDHTGRCDVAPLPNPEAVQLLQAWGGERAADVDAARHICELVGGLPLAVRLAGRYLAQREEAAADYLTWLEETPLTALDHGERQEESVPLLLERSLDQVSEGARDALAVVGILAPAPFGREAVAAALEMSPPEAGRTLGELVDYGLLLREEQRYQASHALMHTYARRRMSPPTDAGGRLAAYYTTLAKEQSALGLPGYAVLDAERPHLMATLDTCVARGHWEGARSLAWAIGGYLDLQGYWIELVAALKVGLAAARALGDRRDEGAFLGNLGIACRELGQVDRPIEFFQQALAIAREIGNRHMEGNELGNLGISYGDLGQVARAIEYSEESLAIAREIGEQRMEGNALGNLGVAYNDLGQVDRAIEYYEQALATAREIGNRRGEGNWLGHLGNAYSDLGQVERAIERYEGALVIAREIGDRRGGGNWLGSLGNAYRALGQVAQALGYYQQALAIAREIGDRHMEENALGNLGLAYNDLGQVDRAIEYYEQALAISREIGDRHGEGADLGNLGSAYAALGEPRRAIEFYNQALAIAREIGDRRGEESDLGNLGLAYAALGEVERAIEYYQQALAIAREIGDRRNEGNWLGNLGVAYRALGEPRRVIEYYQQALAIAREVSDRRNEGNWLGNLGLAYAALGQGTLARNYLEDALAIFEEIKSPTAERIRTWLAKLEEEG